MKVTCLGAVRLPREPTPPPYGCVMTYVIGSACVDVMDKSCVSECPADCIYEGARSLYINPDECVDCGACKLVCRVDAIEFETDVSEDERWHIADNAAFFYSVLPGRDEPLGNPAGAHVVGRVGVDTPMVAAMPANPLPHH
jgi:NAD-dependent dihydropyrimidine dehydrogenase PreA subunit